MLSLQELSRIRELLEESNNPLFFFDNDVDGLCSFLLLRRALDRGRGVAIKSFPDLKAQYLQKIDELKPDLVVVLDKAEVDPEFLSGVQERHIPVVWIDHHESKTYQLLEEHADYFNTYPTCEPVTAVAQEVFDNNKDRWLALVGCIGDSFMPDFAKTFEKENPDLFNASLTAQEALYTTEIGRVARMLNFGLMDSTTNVVSLIKYLFTVDNLYDILEENPRTKQFHKRYAELNEFLIKQVEKAEDEYDGHKVLFHSYAGNTSMSSEIANALFHHHPDKLIVVAFKRADKANVSIRGKNALDITLKAIENLDGATGGGHEVATGAMIPIDDFETFKKNVTLLVGEY